MTPTSRDEGRSGAELPCIPPPTDSGPRAMLAQSNAERNAAYRLRYRVYVSELGRRYVDADHQRGVLFDELDESAELLVVKLGSQVVGTVRLHVLGSELDRARCAGIFELDRFQSCPPTELAVSSRLAIAPQHRTPLLRDLLFCGIYEHALRMGTRLCLVSCVPALVRLFRRYGFREYAVPVMDPVAGRLHRLILALDDVDHLGRTRSPFLPIAIREGLPQARRPWLDQLIAQCQGRSFHVDDH